MTEQKIDGENLLQKRKKAAEGQREKKWYVYTKFITWEKTASPKKLLVLENSKNNLHLTKLQG